MPRFSVFPVTIRVFLFQFPYIFLAFVQTVQVITEVKQGIADRALLHMELLRQDAHHVVKTPPAYFRPIVITGDQLPVTPVHMLLPAGLASRRLHGYAGTPIPDALAFGLDVQIQFVLLLHGIFLFNAKIIKTNNIRNAYLHPFFGFFTCCYYICD